MKTPLLYEQVFNAISCHCAKLILAKGTTDNDVYLAVRDVMRDNPDIFWFSHQWKYTEEDNTVRFFYTIPKEKSEKLKIQIKDVVEKDFHLDSVRTLHTEEQLMYVYKWIAKYCQYNIYAAYHQTICSVFVYRNSVCTGYAKAAQYLLQLLGIESRLVFGKMHNSPDNSRHCWLVINVNGTWYHFDTTFADPNIKHLLVEAGVSPVIGADGFVYNFFCTDTKTIKTSRTIEDEVAMPICNSKIDYSELHRLEIPKNRKIGCLISDVGSTSNVYLYHTHDNQQYVVKTFKSEIKSEFLPHEFFISQKLNGCPHIIQYKGITEDKTGLIVEQATSLSNLVCCHYFRLTIKGFCDLLLDVLAAIKECLDRGIYFRDIHINNVYRDSKGTYKLGDLGSCCRIEDESIGRNGIGSEWYMSPETYRYGSFDEYSATYGVGMLAYFLLNDLYPPFWFEFGKYALNVRLNGKEIPLPLQLKNAKCSEEKSLGNILCKALSFNKECRMSVREMVDMVSRLRELTVRSKEDESIFVVDGGASEMMRQRIQIVTKDILTEFAVTHGGEEKIGASEIPFATTCEVDPNIIISNGETNDGSISDVVMDGAANSIDELLPDSNCDYDTFNSEADAKNIGISFCGRDEKPQIKNKYSRLHDFAYTNAPRPIVEETFLPKIQNKKESIFSRLFNRKKEELVYSSVFAPSQVQRNSNLLVQVYLHSHNEGEKIQELAKEADKYAVRREYMPLQIRLKHGDMVDVELSINGEDILKRERKSIVWQGAFSKCSFRYLVPKEMDINELSCEINLYVNGAMVGEMSFLTNIEERPHNLNAEIKAKMFERIFISYAHQDSEQVKKIALAYKAQGVDYFFDRDNLGGGDIYEEKIFDFIDRADLFLLCWSKNAEQSEYVPKELARALTHAYPQLSHEAATLKIYPISIEPRAPYPNNIQKIYNIVEI